MPYQYPDPCPFCGSEDVAIAPATQVDGSSEEAFQNVACGGCGAQGPYVQGAFNSVKKWNERK